MTTDAHADLPGLGAHPFVALTTFRRSGEPVATPVWLVGDGGDLLVMTGSESGKVKRIRHDARVTVVPCNRRGVVTDGVVPVEGQATVLTDPIELRRVRLALAAKYGLQYRVFALIQRIVARRSAPSVVVRVSAD